MKTIKKRFILVLALMMIVSMFTACSKESKEESYEGVEGSKESNVEPTATVNMDEPITLKFMAPWTDELVKQRITDGLSKKYPNITIELIPLSVDAQNLEETLSKGIIPDIVLAHNGLEVLHEVDMIYPLDEMVESNNFDLSKYRNGVIDAVKARDPEGKNRLLGLPAEDVMVALYYNKDIFDKFGQPYPKDGMTWNQVIDIAKKVTGEMDGIKYRGLSLHDLHQAITQLSVTGTDPETGEPQFSKNPAYANFFDLVKRVVSIPGNYEQGVSYNFANLDVAMHMEHIYQIPSYAAVEGLNFDVVTFPSWPDLPGIGPSNFAYPYVISKHSPYKEQVFKVLEYLVSEENQTTISKLGIPSPLADPNIQMLLATANPKMDGKTFNIEGAYSSNAAKPATYSKFGPDLLYFGQNFIAEHIVKFIDSGDDIPTYLRKMDDEYAAIVTEMKNKK